MEREKNWQAMPLIQPKLSIRSVLRKTWVVFRKRPLSFLFLGVLTLCPGFAATFLADYSAIGDKIVSRVGYILASSLAGGVAVFLTKGILAGKSATLSDAIRHVCKRLFAIIAVSSVFYALFSGLSFLMELANPAAAAKIAPSAGMGGGLRLFVLFLCGIWLLVCAGIVLADIIIAAPVCLLEDNGLIASIRRVHALAAGKRWKIVGMDFWLFAPFYLVYVLFAFGMHDQIALRRLLILFVIIPYAFLPVMETVLFFAIKAAGDSAHAAEGAA